MGQAPGKLAQRRGQPPREDVIQDVEIPVGRGAEFLRFFAADVGMSQVWLCPLRLRSDQAWPLYPLAPGEVYVNFGFWGTVPLPPGRVILASAPLDAGQLPADTTAWLLPAAG